MIGTVNSASRVLLIEDETGVRFGMRRYLEQRGMKVSEAGGLAEALSALGSAAFEAVILDHCLPDGDAPTCLARIKAIDPALPVIVLTGNASIDLAIKAIRQGAEQFLVKPVEMDALAALLARAIELRRLRADADRLALGNPGLDDPFAGDSAAVRALAAEAGRALAGESPVLITGESGSGKSLLARWLHRAGPRSPHAFVDLNCAGFSRDLLESELFGHVRGAFTGAVQDKTGLLEMGNRGIVFLDEIGDMDPLVQGKMLKVVEEKRFRRLGGVKEVGVDIRIIAATHRDLREFAEAGRFREDLYYRLSAIRLHVPALRERLDDLPLLAERMLSAIARELSIPRPVLDESAVRRMLAYGWPGNLRELRHALARAASLAEGGRILEAHLRLDHPLRPSASAGSDAEMTLEGVEIRHLRRVIEATAGNLEAAAVRLGISRSTLYQKIKRHALPVPGRGRAPS